MPVINAGQSTQVQLGGNEAVWVKCSGVGFVEFSCRSYQQIRLTSDYQRIGYLGNDTCLEMRCESGSIDYQNTPPMIYPLTPDSSPVDVAQTVNQLVVEVEDINRGDEPLNVELACNGYKGLTNSLYNSGGFYSVFPGSGITSAEFSAPYGWTFPTAAANKRWFTSGPLTWDMSKKSVIVAFKIKAAAQSSAQTYCGSMSGSSTGFSVVVRASTDPTYPNNIEIRARSGGGNFDSYFISTNLMDDTFHSVTVAFCAATKIMRVWVDGQYNGQAYMTRVMEYQSRGNLVGNERLVIGAAAASGANSWIHSGKSLFYATYRGAITDLDMNKIAFNHHFSDTLGV